MKILILVNGKTFAPEVALSFQKSNIQYKLFTTYPKYHIEKYFVEKNNIKSFLFLEIIKRILFKISGIFKNKLFFKPGKIFYFFDLLVDYVYSFYINKKYDLVITGFNSSMIKSIIKAKKMGIKTLYLLTTSSLTHMKKTKNEWKNLGLLNLYDNAAVSISEDMEKIIKRCQLTIKESDFIAYQSSFQLRTYVEDKFNTKNFFYCPQPTNRFIWKKNPEVKNKFIVIFVGNDFVRKGAKYLIEAFNNLSLNNAELWMVGVDLEKYADILKLNKKNIIFFGTVKEFKLVEIYNKSSVLCVPSFDEGLPEVIPKAMACGLPIITSQYGSDFIKDNINGFLVEPGNFRELEEKIKYLYDNPTKLSYMSEKSLETHNNFFTLERYSEKIIKKVFNNL